MNKKNRSYRLREWMHKLTEKQKKDLLTITILCAAMLALLLIKDTEIGSYVVNQKGEVTKIVRDEESKTGEYHLLVKTDGGDELLEKNVEIVLERPARQKEDEESNSNESSDENEWMLNQVISEIESSEEMSVKLPSKLENGTKVRWFFVPKQDLSPIALLIGYLFLAGFILQSGRYERKRAEASMREEILTDLPRFTNQLLLMMNAGLILKDALERIAGCYERKKDGDFTLLEREICEMVRKDGWNKQSAATHFTELARKYSVKELMRLATILRENEKRGINIIEPLEHESEYLFEHRKLMGREQGKRIDLKMSYPLACLLFLLIIITMAPTMLSL